MEEGLQSKEDELSYLQTELQQQRGMLWLLGEIMKAAVNITEFKQLMSVLTDMLMGVMGVTTCYLWTQIENIKGEGYTIFYRSIERGNEFQEIKYYPLPKRLKELEDSYVFAKEEIAESLIRGINIPRSRLAVPLKNFNDNSIFGVLVLEHEEENFFTNNTVAFFETLSIFISSNAQNSKLLQSVSEESITDPLTETYNRRYLEHSLKYLEAKYAHVTAAVIDTDNFKHINDHLGHTEGDTVLKGIAQLAKGIADEYEGEVIRYGGDEFVILIPRPLLESVHILEEFRRYTCYLRVAYDLDIDVSVTLGVCSYPEIVKDCSELIESADYALLKGKVRGKNRIVLASDREITNKKMTTYDKFIKEKMQYE